MEVNSVLVKSFEKWLQTLGYAESTVYASIRFINDFFTWLNKQNITNLNQVTKSTITAYYKHLQTRKNKKQNHTHQTRNTKALQSLWQQLFRHKG